jgi:iron complex outermembrane recepter protein
MKGGARAAAGLAGAILAILPTAVRAAPDFDFTLPRQPLAESLDLIGKRTHSNIFFSPDSVRGRTAPALNGRYGVDEALHRVLRGSDLGVGMTAGGSYIIARQAVRPPKPPKRAAPSTETIGRVPPQEAVGSEILVSGSRIDAPGFDAPTPNLHVDAATLAIGVRDNIAAALNDLPLFRGTTSPQTTATNTASGSAPIDLRGLGTSRTLVLLDGRRFAGDNDLNSIPSGLVKAVDVVTGGASAAWGSGAVAGVVNIVVDDLYEGAKLSARRGISSRGDAGEQQLSASLGFPFAGDRGHVIIGGEFLDNAGVTPKTSRRTVGRWSTVSAGNGEFRITPDVGLANVAVGGLILSGVLAGKAFNPDGSVRNFGYGETVGAAMIGGEAPSNDDISALVSPTRHYNLLARARLDLSDRVRVSAELRHSRAWEDHVWYGESNRGDITIAIDNAFLSSDLRAQMAAAGQSSFTMGRFNSDFPFPRIGYQRVTSQGTLALDGTFGRHWRWSGYASHGAYRNDIDTPGFELSANFAQAVDAVRDPATGQAVCRVKLTNPSSNCVPINLFGEGAPSAAALAYVLGTPHQRATSTLDVGGISLRGEPLPLPAGRVSVAAGFEMRREAIDQKVGALDAARAFRSVGFTAYSGSYLVKEGFAEIAAPLVGDTRFIKGLNLDAAARISDYGGLTGSIWSWKAGLSGGLLTGLTGRVSLSRDMRAPNLAELYSGQTIGYSTITDPAKGSSAYVMGLGGGNPALKPESADTFTFGLTYSPPHLQRLRIALDYHDVHVRNVITTLGSQDIVTRCYQGSMAMCARVQRDGLGNVVSAATTYLNLSRYRTNGIDADLAFGLPLSRRDESRSLIFRVMANWVDRLVVDDGVNRLDYVGSQGNAFNIGVPRWAANASIGYESRAFDLKLRGRLISAGKFNASVDIINNHIPAYAYMDMQVRARLLVARSPSRLELGFDVMNLFDRQPPPASLYSPYYDVVGRYMAVTIGASI